ncbi:CocE/NonD family hydrolase [Streptomyces sp. QHH-9511]|uniref:CocE/NonD family hydrolase n=1 Tax=Streptomyces sp. QHH-9511 TaxID=2684468 RepID=UPI0013162FA5|nr:CocE/NonD family hydrolase [Streptomyces sp. QHH-9511]QGZ51620.1 CocE/NonD family hydrolase [Streptomyces sp. QHH-9511]
MLRSVWVGGLATDVCLTEGEGPRPAVLIRTPYDRRRHRAELRAWAARGFVGVGQDVRGRYASEGDWRPYRSEAADGAATLAWIRAQEWSDGRVVAVGASYAAHCALAPLLEEEAGEVPDAVVAAVPALGGAEVAREPSGVERLSPRVGWWLTHGDRADSDEEAFARALRDTPGLLDRLPVRKMLPQASWPDVWTARRDDGLWARAACARVPLLAVGGSRDPFADETIRLWRSWGGAARLLLGPWGHGLTTTPAPEAHAEHHLDLGELYARWARKALAATLRGRRGALALGGSAHWCDAATIGPAAPGFGPDIGPDTRTDTRPDTDAGPGARTDRPHRVARPLAYRFGHSAGLRLVHGADFLADPRRPVRSDRLDIDEHAAPDRCLLVTPPLPRPLDLLGDAEARLVAAAEGRSADWAVRLVALRPDGRAQPLATGVARADHGGPDPRPVTVPLGHLARRLPAGIRLRVEVAGHHFPAHVRNPHTGQDPVTATRLLPSRRSVRTADSVLLLPAVHRPALIDPVQEILR